MIRRCVAVWTLFILLVCHVSADDSKKSPFQLIADVKGTVTGVEMSPQGRFGLVQLESGTQQLWEFATKSKLAWIEARAATSSRVIFASEEFVALFEAGGKVEVRKVADGAEVWKRAVIEGDIAKSVASADGLHLAVGKSSGEIVIVQTKDGATVCKIKAPEVRKLIGMSFSEDGTRLLVVGMESDEKPTLMKLGALKGFVFETARGTTLRTMPKAWTHDEVRQIFLFPEDETFATSSDPRGYQFWSIRTGYTGGGGGGPKIQSIAPYPDPHRVLQSLPDGTLRILELDGFKEAYSLASTDGWCRFMSASRDGQWVLTASELGEIATWRIPRPLSDPFGVLNPKAPVVKPTRSFDGKADYIYSIKFLPDAPARALTAGFRGDLTLWEIPEGKPLQSQPGNKLARNIINDIAISPDGKYAALAAGQTSGTQQLSLWHIERWQEVRQYLGHSHSVTTVAFSPDGGTLISGSTDETARVWDVKTGRELQKFGTEKLLDRGPRDPKAPSQMFRSITDVGFSKDGKYAFASGGSLGFKIWQTNDWSTHRELEAAGKFLFRPDSNDLLIVGGGTVTTLDLESGKPTNRVNVSGAQLQSVAHSPNGQWLAFGDLHGAIFLYDAKEGLEQARLLVPRRLKVSALAFSPDNRWLLAGSESQLYLWDLQLLPPLKP